MTSFCFFKVKTREGRVNKMRTQSIALALLAGLVFSFVAVAAPTFTDQDIDNGYVNPKDRIVVQKIMVTDGSSTINSIWIKNLEDADESDITKIYVWSNEADLFSHPLSGSLAGLRTGVTFPFSYTVPDGTSYLWIGVEIASAAHNGRKIQFQMRFYSGSYTSSLITDGSPEIIFRGGFEKTVDHSPSAGYLNPSDADVPVQKATFTDDDGNTSGVEVTKISVSNTENADQSDVASVQVKVTGKVSGTETTYTAQKTTGAADWGSGNPLEFLSTDFTSNLPASFDDNSTLTVEVDLSLTATPKDKNEIQTSITLTTKENGQAYNQSIKATTVQTIRVQGFEATKDVSSSVPSGVLSPGKTLVQKVMLTDDDANSFPVMINGIWIRNKGDSTTADIKQIVVKRASSGTTVFTLSGSSIINFSSGHEYTTGFTPVTVNDDDSATLAIEYTTNDTITDGHTLQPEVHFLTTENGKNYSSDSVTYPKSIVLHPYGLESVNNVSPPNGGTAYSGQRLLAQKISCEDLDENTDSVRINPVRIKNVATTSRCAESEVTKIEVRTESGDLLGEITDLSGLNSGGVTISTLQNNVVADDGSLTLFVYVTFAGPEAITAGHKLKLETTVFTQEDGHAGENSATGAEWTLAINHRPTCDFDYTPATDLTYQTEITFTAKDVNDQDGDAIKSYSWTFSDGGTGTGTSTKHTFAAGGSVWAKLTVEDARGLTGSKQKTLTVTTPPVVPVADFTWAPNAPNVGDEVTFTDASTTPTGTTITKWSWDFDGDGTEDSTEQNPKHTYTAPGTYTVSLTVTNSNSETDSVTHDVVVASPKPTASFTYSPATPDVGDPVIFTNTSTTTAPATIMGWSWNFGDGTTPSISQNPTHSYSAVGTYTVSLTVTDSNNETSSAYTKQITVGPPVMVYSYPNPASTAASIAYRVPEGATDPVLRIYNIAGALVFEQALTVGASPYIWDLNSTGGTAQPNGLYLCVVVAKDTNGRTIKSPTFKLLIAR